MDRALSAASREDATAQALAPLRNRSTETGLRQKDRGGDSQSQVISPPPESRRYAVRTTDLPRSEFAATCVGTKAAMCPARPAYCVPHCQTCIAAAERSMTYCINL